MKGLRPAALALLALAVFPLLILALPSRVDPVAWTPPRKSRPLAGWATNNNLRAARRLAEGRLRGPEDVAFDNAGHLYAGTADGKIVRVGLMSESVEDVASTGGRPLGLMFDPRGRLIVCDSRKGLLAVDHEGRIGSLATEANGAPIRFANGLDIATDGTVYFTDSSDRFGQGEHLYDLIEARPHGRLLRYEPATVTTSVLLEPLYFPNGVALAKDESYVLVAETYRYWIRRLWLKGPKEGRSDVLVANLPGFPDNLSRDQNGTFWVALFTVRNDLMDDLHPHPLAKRLLARLPPFLWPKAAPYGLVANLDAGGGAIRSFHDPGGERLLEVTTARPHDGMLYLGTLERPWLGRYTLPAPFVPLFDQERR
jgi:sugar lactone lactonase YvrE